MEIDETEDVFKRKKVLDMVNNLSNALNINQKWLLYKQNNQIDYINNYDQIDHKLFRKLQEESVNASPFTNKS